MIVDFLGFKLHKITTCARADQGLWGGQMRTKADKSGHHEIKWLFEVHLTGI
jgi:hypothetical protein